MSSGVNKNRTVNGKRILLWGQRRGVPALLIVLLALSGARGAAQSLRVGSPAPPLPPLEYLKGEPAAGFEPGRIYVVEFWATWCPPCRQSVPHLTEMQRRYPGVRFIGVSAWDNNRDEVVRFVENMGDRMAYAVAYDGRRATDRLYMKPAGQRGIPAAFIIAGDGTIAWIGHPMSMAGPLARIAGASQNGVYRNAAPPRGATAPRMRFLAPPTNRPVSGIVTLHIGADPVSRSAAILTAVKINGQKAVAVDSTPGAFVWYAPSDEPGRYKFELLRRDTSSGREFVTDTIYLTVGDAESVTAESVPEESASEPAGERRRTAPAREDHFARSRREVWEKTNAERSRSGLAALPENPTLTRVAQDYAEEMARSGRFDHTGADGGQPTDRARRAGYPSGCGENIALGQRDAAQVMSGWMKSPGHRQNILNPNYSEIGVGHAHGKGGSYWVQLFGTRGN